MTSRKKLINAINKLDDREIQFIVNSVLSNEKYRDLYKRFNKLSVFSKMAVIDELSEIIDDYEKNESLDLKECVCETFGHDFTPWEIDVYYKLEDTVINGEYVENHPIEQKIYRRKCQKCGLSEASRQIPVESDEFSRSKR